MRRTLGWVFAALFALAAQFAAAQYAPFAGAVDAKTLTVGAAGKEAVVEGRISAIVPSTGPGQPTLATITPEGQKPSVVVGWMPDMDATIHGDAGAPKVGARLTAMGKLWDWQGMLLIRVRELNQIRIDSHAHTYLRGVAAPASVPAAAPVAAVPFVAVTPAVEAVAAQPAASAPSAAPAAVVAAAPAPAPFAPDAAGYFHPENVPDLRALVGKKMSYTGKVSSFRASWSQTAPNILTVGEGKNALEVVYWTNRGQVEPPGVSTVGATIYAAGLLQDYRGKLQLRIDDVNTLSAQPLAPGLVVRP